MEANGLARLRSRFLLSSSACAGRSRFDFGSFLSWLGGLLIAALLAGGIGLLARRLSGSFNAPLAAGSLVVVGALAGLWAATGRLLWRQSAQEAGRRQQRIMDWAPTVGLVLIATSAVLPGSSLAAVVVLWLLIVVEEVSASLISRWSSVRRSSTAPRIREPMPHPLGTAVECDEPLAPCIRHQQTRERTADGHEVIHGALRAAFSTGQRVAIEHVVFCPSLDHIPKVSATVLDELESSVRATHVYRYGARLEVKLSEPCEEPLELAVRYDVRS